jgi:serine/threonine-protein kinase
MAEQTQSGTDWTGFTAAEQAAIQTAVDGILASPGFASAARRSRLLRYLVDHAMAGRGEQVTEYGIGLDVFDRSPSFEPRMDSIVRTETSRLRQKLSEYYRTQGQSETIVIELPQRSYVPVLTRRVIEAAKPEAEAEKPKAPRQHWKTAAAIASVLGIAAFILIAVRNRPATAPLTSLVVLPFENYSANRDAEYLADGITEELTNELAQRRDLRVVARTSAFAFKGKAADVREIGRKLNAEAALEGSVSKTGDVVRLTAQLNRTSDGYHLWSHSFEAPFEEIAGVQAQITQSVETALLKTPGPAQAAGGSANPEAHDLYLRASYQFSRLTPEALAKSLELFQNAVDKDPAYGNAYRGIARAEIGLIHITAEAPLPAFERARQALEKALENNADDGEALGQLADIDYVYGWDWPRAEREFRLAMEHGGQYNTHSYYGWCLATRGRFAEAHRQLEVAQDLNPLGPRFNQAMTYLLEHRFEDAKRILHESIESKTGVLDSHLMLGVAAMYQKDCQEASAQFDWFAKQYPSPVADFGLAFAAACNGQLDEARQFIARAEGRKGTAFASPYQAAMARSWVGDKNAALEELEKSAEAREGQILYLEYEPAFDSIRNDARFVELEKKVGLK